MSRYLSYTAHTEVTVSESLNMNGAGGMRHLCIYKKLNLCKASYVIE